MDSIFLPIVLVIFASFFQGSFGLGMKFMTPLKWEAWWLVHSTVAMLIFPLSWALIVVPELFQIIAAVPAPVIFIAMLFGFLWGIGGIMFGKSIPYIGMSLTYGIVMGLASSAGSLIPMFQIENAASTPEFPYVITGVSVMLIGVFLTAYAGILRDRQSRENKVKNLKLGLAIATTLIRRVSFSFKSIGRCYGARHSFPFSSGGLLSVREYFTFSCVSSFLCFLRLT